METRSDGLCKATRNGCRRIVRWPDGGRRVVEAAQELGPAQQVVGQDSTLEPRRVGREVSRRAVIHARPLFQVADIELCLSLRSVIAQRR